MKHFPFPEISISGKYVFSGKHFTATKHSLRRDQFHIGRCYGQVVESSKIKKK